MSWQTISVHGIVSIEVTRKTLHDGTHTTAIEAWAKDGMTRIVLFSAQPLALTGDVAVPDAALAEEAAA